MLYGDPRKPVFVLAKAGPFVGPRGGLWADPKHTVHWDPDKHTETKPEFIAADHITNQELTGLVDRLVKVSLEGLKALKAEIDKRKRVISEAKEAVPLSLLRWGRAVDAAITKVKEEKEPEPKKEVKPILKPTEIKPVVPPQQMAFVLSPREAKVEVAKEAKQKPEPKPKTALREAKPTKKEPKKPKVSEGKLESVGKHVWGSRKDLADLLKQVRSGKRDLSQEDLATMSYDDAAYLVTKGNLVPAWDLNTLKGFGQEPGGAHLSLALVAAVRNKPEDSAEAREQYRSDLRSLLDSLKDCKTADDVTRLITEMGYAVRRASGWELIEKVDVGSDVNWREKAIAKAKKLTEDSGVEHTVRQSYSRGTHIAKKVPKPYEQFGKKFTSLISNPYKSKTWRMARNEAAKADKSEDGWAWLQERGGSATDADLRARRKEALKAAGFSGETKRGWSEAQLWQALKGEPIQRKGYSVEVKDADPNRVKSTFNLQEVGYGEEGYMTQADREYHTKQFEGAMHDFSEVLGVDPGMLSFNGRLSIAFGARGRGAAKAHYEPGGKVINLTKYRGGGSLSHEWGHALDNIVGELFLGKGTKAGGEFLTESANSNKIPDKARAAIKGVLDAMDRHPDPERARREHEAYLTKKSREVSDLVRDSNEIVAKANALQKRPENQEILDRQIARQQTRIKEWKNEARTALEKIKAQKAKGKRVSVDQDMFVRHREYWIKKTQSEITKLKEEGPRTEKDNKELEILKTRAEGYRLEINRKERYLNQLKSIDPTVSDFGRGSAMLGGYYGMVTEKFARCFESFVQDELRAKGRLSDYLTGGRKTEYTYDTATEMPNGKMAQPYPQGEERVAIGKAMRAFLEVLKATGDLEKAMRYVISFENPFRAKDPKTVKKSERFYLTVIK